MAQNYIKEPPAASLSSGQLQGPIEGGLLDMRIFGGETLRWKICFCGDQYTIKDIIPASDTVALSESGCVKAGDCLKIWGHRDACSSLLINGEHKVSAIADGNAVVETDLAALPPQSFVALPAIPGCTSEAVSPPNACHLRNVDDITFSGRITGRVPGDRTRLALATTVTTGSPIVQPKEAGQVFVGDVVSLPEAGIQEATVLRQYYEHGGDWLVLDQSATKSGCVALTSEVGTLAVLEFGQGGCGCITATLAANVTRSLPRTGEKVVPGKGARECAPYYRLGLYSIFASYLNADMQVESELIARGCVEFHPNN